MPVPEATVDKDASARSGKHNIRRARHARHVRNEAHVEASEGLLDEQLGAGPTARHLAHHFTALRQVNDVHLKMKERSSVSAPD